MQDIICDSEILITLCTNDQRIIKNKYHIEFLVEHVQQLETIHKQILIGYNTSMNLNTEYKQENIELKLNNLLFIEQLTAEHFINFDYDIIYEYDKLLEMNLNIKEEYIDLYDFEFIKKDAEILSYINIENYNHCLIHNQTNIYKLLDHTNLLKDNINHLIKEQYNILKINNELRKENLKLKIENNNFQINYNLINGKDITILMKTIENNLLIENNKLLTLNDNLKKENRNITMDSNLLCFNINNYKCIYNCEVDNSDDALLISD